MLVKECQKQLSEAELKVESEIQDKPDLEDEHKLKTEPKTEPKLQAKSKREVDPEPKTEPQLEPKTEPNPEPEREITYVKKSLKGTIPALTKSRVLSL